MDGRGVGGARGCGCGSDGRVPGGGKEAAAARGPGGTGRGAGGVSVPCRGGVAGGASGSGATVLRARVGRRQHGGWMGEV